MRAITNPGHDVGAVGGLSLTVLFLGCEPGHDGRSPASMSVENLRVREHLATSWASANQILAFAPRRRDQSLLHDLLSSPAAPIMTRCSTKLIVHGRDAEHQPGRSAGSQSGSASADDRRGVGQEVLLFVHHQDWSSSPDHSDLDASPPRRTPALSSPTGSIGAASNANATHPHATR